MSAVRSHMGEEAFEAACAQGQAMTFEQAVAYVLSEAGPLEKPRS